MHSLFGKTFVLYLLKLPAGKGQWRVAWERGCLWAAYALWLCPSNLIFNLIFKKIVFKRVLKSKKSLKSLIFKKVKKILKVRGKWLGLVLVLVLGAANLLL